jgi:hypothetical protein
MLNAIGFILFKSFTHVFFFFKKLQESLDIETFAQLLLLL